MSEVGANARGNIVDLLCVQCEEVFGMSAEILLDGGVSQCPHCDRVYLLDGAAGEALDQVIERFRERLRNDPDTFAR